MIVVKSDVATAAGDHQETAAADVAATSGTDDLTSVQDVSDAPLKIATGNDAAELQHAKKDGRKRKRHLFNAIREQMEFYFGDANLSKDRFLKQLIDKDPFVPLDVFLNFNKLKTLTQSVEQIATSLSNSQLLELDETAQKVRRKTAIDVNRNVDDKTLYVEALPSTADHDWVRHVFERFGPVTYVSLPRYATSRKIKEFAFVEFERNGSVEKAVKTFQQVNGVLSLQATDPSTLCSVQAFVREQQQQHQEDLPESKKADDTNLATLKEETDAEVTLDKQKEVVAVEPQTTEQRQRKKSRKRKATAEIDTDDVQQQQSKADEETFLKKRNRIEPTDANEVVCEANTRSTAIAAEQIDDAKMDKNDCNDATVNASDDEEEQEETTAEKKKRKKNKKKKIKTTELDMDPSFFELKILPKRDWKRLRNKYLNLQRQKVAELKRKCQWRDYTGGSGGGGSGIQQQRWAVSQQHDVSAANNSEQHEQHLTIGGGNDEDDVDNSAPLPAKRKKNGDCVHKMNMNFYGAGDGAAELDESATGVQAGIASKCSTTTATKDEAQQRAPLYNRESGLIVEINLLEPCVNIKEFKADMRQYETVKYVDIKEGAMQANLRLESAEAAENLVRQLNCAEYKCKVLRGKAEARYWKKIEADREMKLNKKVKVPQKRGRERVKKLLSTHIRFDDDDVDDVAVAATGGAEDDNGLAVDVLVDSGDINVSPE